MCQPSHVNAVVSNQGLPWSRWIMPEMLMDNPVDCHNWLVINDGTCQACDVPAIPDSPIEPYRLYRFLTDLEDILHATPDDTQRLVQIYPLVRRLLTSSYWLQLEFVNPPAKPGWSVRSLYKEHDFLLTLQMVAWLPGNVSPIHNHGAWGVVALIGGQEKNQFWQRSPTPKHPDRIRLIGEKIFHPGDIVGFLPNAIHSVEPLGDQPAVTFNLYGVTDFSKRFEFDPIHHKARKF